MIRTITLALALAGTFGPGRAESLQAQDPGPAQDREEPQDRERAEANEPTLSTLLAAAERDNPRIEAARQVAVAAEARVPQAGALPDPTLGVGLMNVPLSDPDLRTDRMSMATVQLSGRFPFPGTLGLREDVARLEADAAGWEVERTRLEVRAEVASFFYRLYFIERALDVTGRNEGLLDDFAQLTSTRYGVGTGVQSDVLKAQVERTRLADQLVALREQRNGALARLNALLDRPSDSPVPGPGIPERVRAAALGEEGSGERSRFVSAALADLVPSPAEGSVWAIPDVVELQRLAVVHSPMIQAHVRRVAARERSVALAERAVLPDVGVSLGYSRRPAFGDFFDVMVSVPLPVFAGRKQSQGVLEEEAVLAEHRARHHEMINGLHAEIASLAAELDRAREQLILLDEGILPQAETSLASATASYRVGRVEFLTLLDAQVTLYRHELDYHRLLADFADNLAALERAVGTEVLR